MGKIEVDIHVTNRCTSKCIYCSQNTSNKKIYEFSSDEFATIINQLAVFDIKEIHLTGGEPFIRKDIVDLIGQSFDRGVWAKIATSGIGVSKDALRRLKKHGMEWINFSFDSLSPIIADKHRGIKDSLDHVKSAFSTAVDLGYSVEIMTVVLKDNIGEIPDLCEWVFTNGATQLTVFFASPMGRGIEILDQIPTWEDWEKMELSVSKRFSEIKPRDRTTTIKFETPFFDKSLTQQRAKCRIYEKNHVFIRSDGEVFPCVLLPHNGYSLGNVLKQDFKEIWEKSPNWIYYNEARDNHECQKCEFWSLCKGGCLAYCLFFYDSIGKDPRCKKMKSKGKLPNCIIHFDNHTGE